MVCVELCGVTFDMSIVECNFVVCRLLSSTDGPTVNQASWYPHPCVDPSSLNLGGLYVPSRIW